MCLLQAERNYRLDRNSSTEGIELMQGSDAKDSTFIKFKFFPLLEFDVSRICFVDILPH